MDVIVKKTDKLKRTLSIAVEKEELARDREKVYKNVGKKLKVPGFREGTAPVDLLEKHHAKVLREEFIKWAIPAYYENALKEQNLVPAGVPRISDVECTPGKMAFTARIEVKPEISADSSHYRGIKIKSPMPEVGEKEVTKLLDTVKESVKSVLKKEVTGEDAAKWSGYASVDALSEAARIEIMSAKLRQRRAEIEQQVVDALLKKISCDVPEQVVEDQTSKLFKQETYNLKMKGVSEDDIEKNRKSLEEKCRSVAAEQVKIYYILEAIAAGEVLEVTPQNIYERVMGYLLHVAEYK